MNLNMTKVGLRDKYPVLSDYELVQMNYQQHNGGYIAHLELHIHPEHLDHFSEGVVTPSVYVVVNRFGHIKSAEKNPEPHVFDDLNECFVMGEWVRNVVSKTGPAHAVALGCDKTECLASPPEVSP